MARAPRIKIKVDATGIDTANRRIQAMLRSTGDMRPVMDDIGEALAQRIRDSIAAGRTAAGKRVPKPETGDDRALVETGRMLNSVTRRLIGKRKVVAGVFDTYYAPFVHRGGHGIAPGLFAFTAKRRAVRKDRLTINQIVREHLQQAAAQHGAVSSAAAGIRRAFARLLSRGR